jgi:outer membrane receptor protein involved in Fe transport
LTGANGGRESWKIPSYGLLSLHAGYTLKFDKSALIFKANVFNLLNTIYISDARNNQNGSGFNADDAGVFMGPGMTLNFSLGFEF